MNWYYAEGNQQRGPVTSAEFQQLVADGKITDATLVWREGMAAWQPYGQIRAAVPATPPAQPPSHVPTETTPVSTPSAGPQGWTPLQPEFGKANAMDRVNGPSIGLIVTAAFGFMIALGGLGQGVLGIGKFTMPPDVPPEVARMFENMGGALGILNAVFIAALSAVILMGALKMRKLESYGLCMAASIIALVPCVSPCCCIGLPVGIWALVVISSPDVKPYFD